MSQEKTQAELLKEELFFEKKSFYEIAKSCRKEKEGDIQPVWGFPKRAAKGVKEYRYGAYSHQSSDEFHPPKTFVVLKRETLDICEYEHREK